MFKYIALMFVSVSAGMQNYTINETIELLDKDNSETISLLEFSNFNDEAFKDAGIEMDDANWAMYKHKFELADADGSGEVNKD